MAETVKLAPEDFAAKLGMKLLAPGSGDISFTTPEIGRPGLQIAGYYNHFAPRRVQVIGNSEMFYLYGMSYGEVYERMSEFMRYSVPCIVCARSNMPPDALIDCAKERSVPVFLSERLTDDIGHRISNLLNRLLAPSALIHGELLDVFGVGVLLRGASGLGKSETALELVKEGHGLVADDVVEITRVTDGRLVGRAPEGTRCMMEVRGIGVVDIRYLFGVGAVVREKTIDLVIDLELWDPKTSYGGLDASETTTELLGVEVASALLPVSPGRNLAVVVEVAARNFLLKRTGYDAGGEFARRARKEMERE